MTIARRLLPVLLTLLAASCATPPRPAPPPPTTPKPAPAPASAPDWRDLAETAGRWRYVPDAASSTARYETLAGGALFSIRCDRASRRVTLARGDGVGALPLKITTSYGSRTLPSPDLAATDSLLDQIAFSRGRFTVEAPNRPELVLPAWAEPARVIEDCRG